jgi:hypothetical protein
MNQHAPYGLSLLIVLLIVLPAGAADGGASATREPTTIRVTDRVLVKDCTPLGTNLNGRNLLKKHVEVNFEGSSHRVCLNGEIFRDGFLQTAKKR